MLLVVSSYGIPMGTASTTGFTWHCEFDSAVFTRTCARYAWVWVRCPKTWPVGYPCGTLVLGGTMNPMMRWACPRVHWMYWLMFEKLLRNIWQNTVYQQRKMIRGAVLDLPLKGKMTETSVAEGTMSIVQPTPRTSWASGHLSIFWALLNKGVTSNKDLMKNWALSAMISLSIQYEWKPLYFCMTNVSYQCRLIAMHCTDMIPPTAHVSLCDHSLTLCIQVTPFTQQHFNLGLSVHSLGHSQQFRWHLFEPAAIHMQRHSQNLAENVPPSFYCGNIFVLIIVLYCITISCCKLPDPPCYRCDQSYNSLRCMAVKSGGLFIFFAN